MIVVGLSPLGRRLAEEFAGMDGVELVLIDPDEDRCSDAANRYDALVLKGEGTDPEILEKAGAGDADALVVATDSDPINTVVGILAKRAGVEKVIVVLNDPALRTACLAVGVDEVISPVLSAAAEIKGLILGEEHLDLSMAVSGGARLLELPPGPLAGKKLGEIKLPKGTIVPMILRGGRALIPAGETVLDKEDVLILLAESEEKLNAAKRLFLPDTGS